MNLVDWSIIIMGGWTLAMIATGLVMALRPGSGELEYDTPSAEPLVLRQAAGVMPRKAWGFRPAVHHSQYDPAPWQVQPPRTDDHSTEVVERATDIKRELGSEHPPWERLDRQGL
jgi:hypothetical protein